MDRHSPVGIATHYGLDGPVIESRCGRDFPPPIQTGPVTYPASYTIGTGSLSRGRAAGPFADHSPASSTEVKETVELYLCSALMAGYRANCTFYRWACVPDFRILLYFQTIYYLIQKQRNTFLRAQYLNLPLTQRNSMSQYFHIGPKMLPPPLARQPPSGPGPPHCRGFTITFRHTTLGRTPLDEWSAWRRDLCLITYNIYKTSMPPGGNRTRNPSHASGRRRTP